MNKKTGRVRYLNLEEYDVATNQPTGNVKPNYYSDSDYIPPHENNVMCAPGTIIINPTTDIVPAEGGTVNAMLYASHPWTVTKRSGGYLFPLSGDGGPLGTQVSITFFTSMNSFDIEHEIIFTLDSGAGSATMRINQKANYGPW